MKNFFTITLPDNGERLAEMGEHVSGLVALMELQTMCDGVQIHDEEFKSYDEYAEFVKPLFDTTPDTYPFNKEFAANSAIIYISRFFYLKGLQDSAKIREGIFMGI